MLGPIFSTTPESTSGPPAQLFPSCVRVAFSDGREEPPALFPEEAEAVRDAVASRRREFALGRWCARRALTELGVAAQAIQVGQYRAPCWPADVVGSITHCTGFVGAAVAPTECLRAIGFDAERAESLDADIVSLICTPAEIAWARERQDGRELEWAKVIFSAKEAIHKCVWPLFGQLLDFLDVTLALDPVGHTFSARAATPAARAGADLACITGRVAVTKRLVFTCAFVESSPGSVTT
ncbi:MAG TPA: 4'-phosphopantetheinyl transferase superfamily protein [Gemmatimonadaceae bacterium]|nr:4'-phosphopantetheinyl transferase superfamily protein [Gemmatimonadaceae bacterium]